MENKVKAWGIEQAVWGRDAHDFFWFANKEDRDRYYNSHDYCDKLRCRMVDKEDVFNSYAEYEESMQW